MKSKLFHVFYTNIPLLFQIKFSPPHLQSSLILHYHPLPTDPSLILLPRLPYPRPELFRLIPHQFLLHHLTPNSNFVVPLPEFPLPYISPTSPRIQCCSFLNFPSLHLSLTLLSHISLPLQTFKSASIFHHCHSVPLP